MSPFGTKLLVGISAVRSLPGVNRTSRKRPERWRLIRRGYRCRGQRPAGPLRLLHSQSSIVNEKRGSIMSAYFVVQATITDEPRYQKYRERRSFPSSPGLAANLPREAQRWKSSKASMIRGRWSCLSFRRWRPSVPSGTPLIMCRSKSCARVPLPSMFGLFRASEHSGPPARVRHFNPPFAHAASPSGPDGDRRERSIRKSGTFQACRRALAMSVHRGKPEVAGQG